MQVIIQNSAQVPKSFCSIFLFNMATVFNIFVMAINIMEIKHNRRCENFRGNSSLHSGLPELSCNKVLQLVAKRNTFLVLVDSNKKTLVFQGFFALFVEIFQVMSRTFPGFQAAVQTL